MERFDRLIVTSVDSVVLSSRNELTAAVLVPCHTLHRFWFLPLVWLNLGTSKESGPKEISSNLVVKGFVKLVGTSTVRRLDFAQPAAHFGG